MSIKEKMEPLDNLFLALFTISFAVPAIGQSFGMDPKLLWMPTFMFAIWTLYIGYYRGVWKFRDYPELAMVERMRGWSYLLNLAGTLIANGILFFSLIRMEVVGAFIGFLLAGGLPVLFTFVVTRTLFEKETLLFTSSQRKKFIEVSSEVGSASISLSVSIVTTNFYLLFPILAFPLSTLIMLITLGIILQALLLLRASIYEMRSRHLAYSLANWLKESRWWRRYSYTQKRKRGSTN